ncbi:hypothetical protein GCM10010211_74440 [Streptomyces albospinus]|uniref:Uncharacterized protein n=1 Tax=Streptomyces albospinus TaxID=285515 RepID=A0ABQ2VM17_9ACTN|nr:hypothetical protein GCM10010211_74440 [Streptomyces albospinus]
MAFTSQVIDYGAWTSRKRSPHAPTCRRAAPVGTPAAIPSPDGMACHEYPWYTAGARPHLYDSGCAPVRPGTERGS